MSEELSQLIGALHAIEDSAESKEVKALAKALSRYFNDTSKQAAGFSKTGDD